MSERINLPDQEWQELMSIIDNEGFCYFVMHYIGADGFSKMVNGDAKAIELFKAADKTMTELRTYLKVDDY